MPEPVLVTESDEMELVALAGQGDRQAFNDLVRRHREGVIRVVYRICGSIGMAEDAAQEAFIRAWQHLADYKPRSPFRNWLYRIATNVALDMLRREKETVPVDDLPLPAAGPTPETAIVSQERAALVQQAISGLPDASRAVLVLREFEGMSYKEIAFTLDIPLGTVMSRLNYARNLLRTALAASLEVA